MGLFCSIFYEKMGFNLVTIFLAHFDRETIQEIDHLRASSSLADKPQFAISWGLVPVMMAILLPDFLELNENLPADLRLLVRPISRPVRTSSQP